MVVYVYGERVFLEIGSIVGLEIALKGKLLR